jgi:hypothetical protein
MRDRIQERKNDNAYISNQAKIYSDNQINGTGMKGVPSDLSTKETKKFARQVNKNIRSSQRNDLNAIQDENNRARVISRMSGDSDRLVNNYNDSRNNYVTGQNNKTTRTNMRQDYRTKRDDMIDDSDNQRQANANENRQNNFNSRFAKKMNRLESNRTS